MALYWLCALTSMLTIYVNYPITTTSVCPLILLLHPELSATVLSTVNGLMFSRVQQRLLVTRSPALGSNFFPAIEIYSHTLDASVSNGLSRSFYNLSLLYFSLRSKRFRLVSEQKKKNRERDFLFWPREKWNESHFSRRLWLLFLVLCS